MKKLYVGNLPYTVNDAELKEWFSKAGTVSSASVLLDRMMNNRSRGFGFVEFENDAEALAAIEMYHNKEVGGRTLVVNEARAKTDAPMRRAA